MSFQKLGYLFEICPPKPWPFGLLDPLVALFIPTLNYVFQTPWDPVLGDNFLLFRAIGFKFSHGPF